MRRKIYKKRRRRRKRKTLKNHTPDLVSDAVYMMS